jgi:hypothetical protein
MNPIAFQLRIMQFTMILSVLLFFFVSRTVQPPAQIVNFSFQWAVVLCATASALSGFILQRMLMRAPSQSLLAAQDSTRLARWRMGHIIRFATAESVALFGFVLRTLGSSSTPVYLLFGSGLLLLLFWQPGVIPIKTESQGSIG